MGTEKCLQVLHSQILLLDRKIDASQILLFTYFTHNIVILESKAKLKMSVDNKDIMHLGYNWLTI